MDDLQEPLLQPKSVADKQDARQTTTRTNGKLHGEKETLAELQALDIRYTKLLQVGRATHCYVPLGNYCLLLATSCTPQCNCIKHALNVSASGLRSLLVAGHVTARKDGMATAPQLAGYILCKCR